MKSMRIALASLALTCLVFSSCDKMLYVESDRYLYAENNTLSSPADSMYSLMGILSKMQLVGDRYVLLGELRADMMEATHHADQYLHELSSLTISKDNPYADANDFYVVINHCNYLIQRMDTSLVTGGERRLKREYAAAKVIRAWTYLQLVLNYGEAYYFEHPILTIEESQAITREKTPMKREAVLAELLNDLLPLQGVPMPNYGDLASFPTSTLLLSLDYLLGEIYLWQNNYERAAYHYYKTIYQDERVVHNSFVSSYAEVRPGRQSMIASTWAFLLDDRYYPTDAWSLQFTSKVGKTPEVSAAIGYYYSPNYGMYNQSSLSKMTQASYELAPSQRAMDLFENKVYTDQTSRGGVQQNIITMGDLRGYPGSYNRTSVNIANLNTNELTPNEIAEYEARRLYHEPLGTPYITFYTGTTTSNSICLQRNTVAYLRYAEAVNRMGMPSVALAVINYGLNEATFSDSTKVNFKEVTPSLVEQWRPAIFAVNMGTRPRGMGLSTVVTFPPDVVAGNLQDSINYVEEVLIEELALESAFQGNRFHDLLRFTHHRPEANYIAKALALKHPNRRAEFEAKTEDDWYLAD